MDYQMIVASGGETRIDKKTLCLLMGLRQVLIMALGLLEDYLDMDRSIVPKRKRD